jgi:hypothetical protein
MARKTSPLNFEDNNSNDKWASQKNRSVYKRAADIIKPLLNIKPNHPINFHHLNPNIF